MTAAARGAASMGPGREEEEGEEQHEGEGQRQGEPLRDEASAGPPRRPDSDGVEPCHQDAQRLRGSGPALEHEHQLGRGHRRRRRAHEGEVEVALPGEPDGDGKEDDRRDDANRQVLRPVAHSRPASCAPVRPKRRSRPWKSAMAASSSSSRKSGHRTSEKCSSA